MVTDYHIVSISGGMASAVAADIVINKYGLHNVTLWFADSRWEDDDTYRFLDDCLQRWHCDSVICRDGRTPPEVWADCKIIPNSLIAPCNRVLKIVPFRKFVSRYFLKPVTVHLGFDWQDTHRLDAPRRHYEALSGVIVNYPLLELAPFDLTARIESWGISPPRMYKLGFPHNNCGGRCPKQGKREWRRLKTNFPDRFDEMAEWEQWARSQSETRATKTFLKNISLKDLSL